MRFFRLTQKLSSCERIMQNSHSILKYINRPSKVLLWDLDEALSFLLPFGGLCLEGKFFLGVIVGFCVFQFVKLSKGRGVTLVHLTYWYLPTPVGRLKFKIASYKREYIG